MKAIGDLSTTRGIGCPASLDSPNSYAILLDGFQLFYGQEGVSKLPKVTARTNESPDQLLRRFKKEVMKSKVLADVRRKRWHVSRSELKRIEKKKAIRRLRKKVRSS